MRAVVLAAAAAAAAAAALGGAMPPPQTDPTRVRARTLGVAPGVFDPGPLNAMTDVADVRVGHVTLIRGDRVRTGVTAIVPHGGNVFVEKVPAGVFVGNAFGKLAGSTQIQELGTLETPIVLTNTLAVGTAVEAVVRYTLEQAGNDAVRSVNAVVGETNDGQLNDIRSLPVTAADVRAALAGATGGAVAEGNVGAGTGTTAFGWKGGIGTSSRRLPDRFGGHTLGVLVQANFGGVLSIDGVAVGRALGRHPFGEGPGGPGRAPAVQEADGSCLIVVATDAPISARDLERLAARAVFGLARTGSSYSHGSGDYALAFSAAPAARIRPGDAPSRVLLPSEALSPLFQAALEATEEAVYNALFMAETMTGSGRTVEALPLDRVRALLRR